MAFAIIAEALSRIEHKADAILRALQFLGGAPIPPLSFVGTPCPVCSQAIDYQIDLTHNVVVRRCGCKTGKLPPTIPLIPAPGVNNGNPASGQDAAAQTPTEGGPRRPTGRFGR